MIFTKLLINDLFRVEYSYDGGGGADDCYAAYSSIEIYAFGEYRTITSKIVADWVIKHYWGCQQGLEETLYCVEEAEEWFHMCSIDQAEAYGDMLRGR